MANLTTDEEYASVTIQVFDNHTPPRPAAIDGPIVWASSDETVIVGEPTPDGLSGKIKSVAPGGPARMTFTGDADLGAGVVPVTGVTEDITVIAGAAGAASVFTVELGPATPKA